MEKPKEDEEKTVKKIDKSIEEIFQKKKNVNKNEGISIMDKIVNKLQKEKIKIHFDYFLTNLKLMVEQLTQQTF